MRVLLVNTVCSTGSTGRICTDLYKELVNNGHECCIAYGRGDAGNVLKTYKIGNNTNIIGHYLLSRIFGVNGFLSKNSTINFINYIEEFKPDIIHLHNLHGYYINIKILFKFLKNFPGKVVWTLHDCWSFSGYSAFIDYEKNNKVNGVKSGFFGSREYPKSFINFSKVILNQKKEIFTSLDTNKILIITPSEWLKNMVESTYLKKYNVKRIYNGIDTSCFRFKPSNHQGSENYILGCTNIWDERKGLNDILYLSEKMSSYQFVIVGKVKKKKKYKNVTYIDRTESIDELVSLYTNAKVFINPTYQDNFPTTNIEALACGTPVITYRTGGSAESLNEKTGVIVEKGDIDSLEASIEKVMKLDYNPSICSDRGSEFSRERMFADYIDTYKKLYKH